MGGEWIQWAGGECPVDGDTIVEVRFRDDDGSGARGGEAACAFSWGRSGFDPPSDIVAYRLVPIQ